MVSTRCLRLRRVVQVAGGDERQTVLGKSAGGGVDGVQLIHEVQLHGVPITGGKHLIFNTEIIDDI